MALLVNGEYVADRLFFEEFQRLHRDTITAQMPMEALREAAKEHVIQRTLLHQMAVQEGFQVSVDEVEAERRRRWGSADNSICGVGILQALEVDLFIQKIGARLTKHVPRPSRAEVEKFYRANPARIHQPERVLAAHIVKNVEKPADEAKARELLEKAETELNTGKSFTKVADAHSDCSGSAGVIGWIARGEMVEEFDEVVFNLKKGERSPIFRTTFGWHIATVFDRKPAGTESLEEVRPLLSRRMFEARRKETILSAVADFARRSTIAAPDQDDRGPVVAEEVEV